MKIPFLLVVPGLLAQLVHTAPSGPIAQVRAEKNATAAHALSKRGGYHRASVYTVKDCKGWPTLDVEDFGCGGACHRLNPSYSIYLQQRTTGNPKPTADLYYTYDCTGPRAAHAGIWSGQLAGCTNLNGNNPGWLSVVLYNNC